MPRGPGGARRRRRQLVLRGADRLKLLLDDMQPHSNAEIWRRTGLRWDNPLLVDVRRHLRDHGVFITPHSVEGFWVRTAVATEVRKHLVRRAQNAYTEACRNARALAGELARNPSDRALAQELNEQRRLVYHLSVTLGRTPNEVAVDLAPVA